MTGKNFKSRKFPFLVIFIIAIELILFSPYICLAENTDQPQSIDAAPYHRTQIQCLIDVSGSMKQNDPKNVRIPTTRLLIELLPAESQAGIFLFGTTTRPLLPFGRVDATWQDKAISKLSNISSSDAYTNIGDALRTSMNQFSLVPGNKIIFLITDGKVDVSKDSAENAKAAADIINNIQPELRQRGIKVFSIGLSDEADLTFLKQLSVATHGRYMRVLKSEDLPQNFFELFDGAYQKNSLPIIDGGFNVDHSIRELHVLSFNHGQKLRIQAPDGSISDTSDNLAGNSFKSDDLALVRIKNPLPGKWQILNESQNNNRVMVAADIELAMTQLPNQLYQYETLSWIGSIEAQGKVIKNEALLTQLRFDLQIDKEIIFNSEPYSIFKMGQGKFSIPLFINMLEEGQHKVILRISGPLLQREYRQNVMVKKPIIETKFIGNSLVQLKTSNPGVTFKSIYKYRVTDSNQAFSSLLTEFNETIAYINNYHDVTSTFHITASLSEDERMAEFISAIMDRSEKTQQPVIKPIEAKIEPFAFLNSIDLALTAESLKRSLAAEKSKPPCPTLKPIPPKEEPLVPIKWVVAQLMLFIFPLLFWLILQYKVRKPRL